MYFEEQQFTTKNSTSRDEITLAENVNRNQKFSHCCKSDSVGSFLPAHLCMYIFTNIVIIHHLGVKRWKFFNTALKRSHMQIALATPNAHTFFQDMSWFMIAFWGYQLKLYIYICGLCFISTDLILGLEIFWIAIQINHIAKYWFLQQVSAIFVVQLIYCLNLILFSRKCDNLFTISFYVARNGCLNTMKLCLLMKYIVHTDNNAIHVSSQYILSKLMSFIQRQ